jgi:amino acid permease
VAALIALLVGAGDLIVVLIDGQFRVGGAHTAPGGVIFFSILMLVCAWGMWQQRYWAVLGFQAILVFVILIFSLLLLRANNLLAVLTGVLVVGGGGYLFYKLVRVLSRLQMPQRPGH